MSGRTLPSTESIEPPATIPAPIGIPADEVLQHILEAVSPGSMDVPDAAALRVLERDGQLNLGHDTILGTEKHSGV
jgi:hypothetical protein